MTTGETTWLNTTRGSAYQRTSVLFVFAGALVGLVTTLLPWVTAETRSGQQLSVTADAANPATLALSLTSLAGAAALWLVGRWPRVVLGALLVLIGGVAVVTVALMADGEVVRRAFEQQLQLDPSGALLSGDELVPARTLAPWLAMLGGVLVAIGGALAAATAQLWPAAGRRFAVSGGAAVASAAHSSADVRIDQWDALSAGEDPTLGDEDASGGENSQ